MKKNEIYSGNVVAHHFPDRGTVESQEAKVTVKGTLPGQTVSFVLKKKRGERMEGRLLEVLKRSPYEIPSPCPHFGICGGCSYQNLSYESQLSLKGSDIKELLKNALSPFGDEALTNGRLDDLSFFEGVIPSPVKAGYRNKMEYSFGNERLGGSMELGMHKAGRHNDVITVDSCLISDGDFRLILKATLDFFRNRNISFYRKQTGEGYLRHLIIRKGFRTGEILINLITASRLSYSSNTEEDQSLERISQSSPDKNGAASSIRNFSPPPQNEILKEYAGHICELSLEGNIAGILHTVNDSPSDAVKPGNYSIITGRDFFYEKICGLSFRISPFSFFQTNSLGAELLYEKVREYVFSGIKARGFGDRKPLIFDLYSGTGTMTQLLAPAARQSVGTEIVPEAVEAARLNAKENGLENVSFIEGDVLKTLEQAPEKPDIIILDPPRDGCSPKALERILKYEAPVLIYVSCKPTSLTRDLQSIIPAGYKLERCAAVDMFPFTGNVETVCLLSKRKPDTKARIDVDLEDYYRIKDSKKSHLTEGIPFC